MVNSYFKSEVMFPRLMIWKSIPWFLILATLTAGADAEGPTTAGRGTPNNKSRVSFLQTSNTTSHLPFSKVASKPMFNVSEVSHLAASLPIRERK